MTAILKSKTKLVICVFAELAAAIKSFSERIESTTDRTRKGQERIDDGEKYFHQLLGSNLLGIHLHWDCLSLVQTPRRQDVSKWKKTRNLVPIADYLNQYRS